MSKNHSDVFTSNFKKHFSKLEKQSKFIPGISKIPLAVPPYGWEEVSEAVDEVIEVAQKEPEKTFEDILKEQPTRQAPDVPGPLKPSTNKAPK